MKPHIITGFVTKGGRKGWVSMFKVKYSNDRVKWSNILDSTGSSKNFFANNDRRTAKTNYLPIPINARYVRLYPFKWQKAIQMRVEPIGCFEPYGIDYIITYLLSI